MRIEQKPCVHTYNGDIIRMYCHQQELKTILDFVIFFYSVHRWRDKNVSFFRSTTVGDLTSFTYCYILYDRQPYHIPRFDIYEY